MNTTVKPSLDEAVRQLREAAAAKKCWQCSCLHSSLRAIEEAFPPAERPADLDAAIQLARARLTKTKYDCLGCEVCFPAIAINALAVEGDACPAETVQAREGWPPLPGSYSVLRYHAPVAVCTLTDDALAQTVATAAETEVAIVGTMQTENLGIERLIQNTVANPNIRFLVLCGADSRQVIGHLPGRSLAALASGGVDDRMRIVGAPGRRPVLRNLNRETVEHFRRSVEVVDLVGEMSGSKILETVKACATRDPGPAQPLGATRAVATIAGYVPQRMTSDPAGYFVVFPDRARRLLMLEHYRNDGVLDVVIEGASPAELYIPAVEKALVSRLDHAAYLGRELARAEHSLRTGEAYVQDAAAERQFSFSTEHEQRLTPSACGCGSSCKEDQP
jgi:tetrahydromethanopterin S-methyltransferase subunit A